MKHPNFHLLRASSLYRFTVSGISRVWIGVPSSSHHFSSGSILLSCPPWQTLPTAIICPVHLSGLLKLSPFNTTGWRYRWRIIMSNRNIIFLLLCTSFQIVSFGFCLLVRFVCKINLLNWIIFDFVYYEIILNSLLHFRFCAYRGNQNYWEF